MTDSNRTRVAYVEEATIGTTPAIANGNLREARITGESLAFKKDTKTSDELRSDRQRADYIDTNARNNGGVNFELSYPADRTFISDMIAAALFSDWGGMAKKVNVTADTAITDVASATGTYTIDAQPTPAFVAGHMVQSEGFTNAANNQIFRATSVTATTVVGGSGCVNETAPPSGSRITAIGYRGVSADISLSTTAPLYGGVVKVVSATLDWATTGLEAGRWVKLSGFTDNSGANNYFGYVTALSGGTNREFGLTNIATLSGEAAAVAEVGTAKTVTVWFGERVRNGTTRRSFTMEKGFLAQAVPSYLLYRGMVPNTLSINFAAEDIAKGSLDFLGTRHTTATAQLGSPAASTSGVEDVLNCATDLSRLAEAGAPPGALSGVKMLSLQVNNNLREQTAISTLGLAGVGVGSCDIALNMEAYFGDKTLYDKYVNGTQTSLSTRLVRGTRALFMTVPAIEIVDGDASAGGLNQDVTVPLQLKAKRDTTLGYQLQFDRMPYFE